MIKRIITIAASITMLSGCQAMVYGTSTDFEKISIGMNKSEVIAALGKPVAVGADADKQEETLSYKRMRHAISAWPKLYEVVLRSGKVIRFGEKDDRTPSTPTGKTN